MAQDRRRERARRLGLRVAVAAAALAAVVVWPGFAPATITEQRNRLPPPAFCEDEVEGLWRSHAYWEGFGQWYIVTLEVHRDRRDRNALTGVIVVEFWDGRSDRAEPPTACMPGQEHYIVRQPATGNIASGVITFGGTSWQLDRAICGGTYLGYNPDVFSGRIDPAIQEFQSVNNDGGAAVNLPVVFRRVRCFDPDSTPHVTVSPPPFLPPRPSGCSAGP